MQFHFKNFKKKFSAFKFSPKLWDKPARNSLQFFTIPLGYLLGGALVDTVFEPFMAAQTPESLFCCLFGTGKGSGATFFVSCPRLPRRRRLPLLPPQQAYPRVGSERQRLKS